MQGESVLYDGRMVSKEGFRAFIYGRDDQKKCVNSWLEFEEHMASGLWFASLSDVLESQSVIEDAPVTGGVLSNLINPKPKGKRR
jgi:hypothetical protein